MEKRWFISYRVCKGFDFLESTTRTVEYKVVITNIPPAKWVREHTGDHHIQYAELISISLASELIHCGAGVSAEYYEED